MASATLALPPRYSGTELLASGGMADVYVATDDALERKVAVKALSNRFANDPEIRQRFTREARIAAGLSNEPNVVTIYDVTDVGGRPAIVMEFLSGGTLEQRMARNDVPPALALAWLEQAARGLDAAHVAGVVHRDVKPANLMLSGEGELRVTDFGIARVTGDAALTSVGTVLGTSGYMSPEQAVGGTATAASDRYALAVVAFELLSGRRPYLAETFAAEASAHATAPVPAASRFNSALPRSVDSVLERGLAKDPQARFQSCGELVAGLRAAFAESAGTTVRMVPIVGTTAGIKARGRRNRLIAAGLGGAALAGVVLAAVLSNGGGLPEIATVVQTQTVAGAPEVRTVTVETQAPAPAVAPTTTAGAPPGDPGQSGAALNDEGFRLLQAGDAGAALPLLEQSVDALRGSGSLDEAYASYNLAVARIAMGDCHGVAELLERSEEIQGKRSEINRLRKDIHKDCED